MNEAQPILSIKDISKHFGGVMALRDVDFTLPVFFSGLFIVTGEIETTGLSA